MEMYFGSFKLKKSNNDIDTLVTFDIPDIGVKFKAPYQAKGMVIDYASLLTLLEFVEVNPQLFSNRALELYTNNFDLINQVNNNKVDNTALAPYLQKALEYRDRLNYTLNWVSRPDNPALRSKID
ncbi:MAG: hypothetical protein V3V99_12100 [candidate division Zixibacteria bacterium]